jgi:hypothetical protein
VPENTSSRLQAVELQHSHLNVFNLRCLNRRQEDERF